MAKVNASIPQGTRDFGAATVRKRNHIFNIIRQSFELYGFQPLETPAMENLDTLMGKYGDEGDKLIFKILNNGLNDPKNIEKAKTGFEQVLAGKNNKNITERALRYDLTIPFARYVSMNIGQLTLPFKRYQIQPVWRADRPQKGRYREFYQCDADVVGSHSLLNEIELTTLYATVFRQLGIPVEIKINSRKILAALAEICGGSTVLNNITIAIDKLDKIGMEKVKEELLSKGLQPEQIAIIEQYLLITGSNQQKMAAITQLLGHTDTGKKGIEELQFIIGYPAVNEAETALLVDFTLARGLDYYTGAILEVKASNVQMGSIGGGGRYDDLTGTFGVPGIPGVGISFGVDRIYDVMEELQLFPAAVQTGTTVLFFNLGAAESSQAFTLMQQLRKQQISCELYPETVKFDKQFKYAEKKNIRFVVIIGSQELANATCTIKDLQSGEQQTIAQQALLQFAFS
ncbi:MAG TPA: histidine--tRNA ligase [Chitinophagaceae bacterium]|nr:histidine--tRNA ligase [Chitinophagaceae bacterium]